MTALGATYNGEPLSIGLLTSGNDLTTAGRVDGNRLFNEAVLAGFDCGIKVQRAEIRRGRHQDVVAVFGDGLLICIKAAEALAGIEAVGLTELFRLCLEGIRSGDKLALDTGNLAGFEEVLHGTGATATAANDDAFEFFGASGRVLGESGTGEDRGACQGAIAEKRTTIQVIDIHDSLGAEKTKAYYLELVTPLSAFRTFQVGLERRFSYKFQLHHPSHNA